MNTTRRFESVQTSVVEVSPQKGVGVCYRPGVVFSYIFIILILTG